MFRTRAYSLLMVLALTSSFFPVGARPSLAAVPQPPAIEPELSVVSPAPVSAPVTDNVDANYRPGELLIRFSPAVGERLSRQVAAGRSALTTGEVSLDALSQRYQVETVVPIFSARAAAHATGDRLADVYLLSFPAPVDVMAVAGAYSQDAAVVYAEPNYRFEFDGTPDDPAFGQQWYLHNTGQYWLDDADIDAPEAWDVITGTGDIVIAVIDTGVDRDHPDLANRIWTNPGETPGNGIDEDHNGYTDDTWGWNWVSDVANPDDYEPNDPRDDNGHGTHVAGIAAAETDNGIGVAGVCWNCRIMSLKAFESNGVGTTSDIVQAIDYAAAKGAHVINMSFGSYAESLLLEDTLANAYGRAVLVAAAGNYGRYPELATRPYYPASYPYVLGVGATDVGCVQRDPLTTLCLIVAEHRADFSNHGVNADVGAPGVSIYSTFRGSSYASLSGTSMAAPAVSGLAALLLSQHGPGWSKELARAQIIQTAEAIYSGEFGRANAYNALTVVPTPELTLVADSLLYGDSSGDGDGIPDAGETFSITLELKNFWGEALSTTAVLSTTDPYVAVLSHTATFGDISAYATLRNSATPFQITLADTAPNNHLVSFDLDISANGGGYYTSAGFSFLVQRGIEIPDPLFPAVITQSMTLHSDYLYLVKQNMLVQHGITLTIEPGTRLQFDTGKFIKVQGTLIASGTAELPIYFTSNQKEPQPGDFRGIIFDDQATDAVLDPIPITTTLAAEGDSLPGIGAVVTISGTPRFDSLGDVYFSAVISGTPDFEQVLHWYNGVGLVEASSDPLPAGSATSTPFSETVSLVDTGSGKRVVFARPSEEYVSGSILNHIILEYGGGLLIDDSFPYVANSTFRQSKGILPSGTSGSPPGVVVVDRQTGSDSHSLIIRNNMIVDNPNRGLYIPTGRAAGRLTFSENTVSNNLPSDSTGGGVLIGVYYAVDALAVQLRGNVIQYNRAQNCAGAAIAGYSLGRLRLEGNTFRRNEAYNANVWEWDGSSTCLNNAPALLRRNTWVGNIDQQGYQPGSSVARGGGSAFRAESSAPVAQFNTIIGNLSLPWGTERTAPGNTLLFVHQPEGSPARLNRNNILANQASFDLYLSNFENAREDLDATRNYWGTNDANEIRYHRIYDYWQDFEPGEATFQPFLTAPEPLAPGFLLSVTTTPPSPVGAQVMTVTLDFSRDMNTAISPTVSFGVDEPYTQHAVESGRWISPTRWAGACEVTVETGDGTNTLKVRDAEDTDGMPIPEDTRFGFVIQTAGTQAVLLEGIAGVGQVELTWTQNDVTDLAGYILYRSAVTNTAYTQVGGGMFVTTAYTDTQVTNGVTYYYRYSVLDTDFNEVVWSNEISVTPDDYTLPYTPAVVDDGAITHFFDRLHASWSSGDPETGIAEYQVCIGTATNTCDTVSWTSMGAQTEATKTGLNLAHGQTYYLNAKARNGADHWSAVGSTDGIAVDKLPPPVITAVEPITGVRTTAHVITFTGSGFQASPSPVARLGTTALGGVNVLGPTRLTAVVPAGIPAGAYAVSVINFDTQLGTLANAYTATNPSVGPRPFLLNPDNQRVGDDEGEFTLDVRVQDVTDLAAFQFDLGFDPAVVHVEDVTLGAFLGSGGRNTAALGPEIDNGAGTVSFGGFSYGGGSGADGSGTLATITFSPQVTGTAGLALENVILADTLGSQIPAAPQGGQVQVVHYPFGDLDRDCDVDVVDIMFVANRWNTRTGQAGYDPAYDFDNDGEIDVLDIMRVAAVWGDSCGGRRPESADTQRWPAGDGVVVSFRPETLNAAPGEPLTAELWIDDATQNLGGFEVDIRFDPQAVTVSRILLGDHLGSTGNTAVALGPRLAEPGRLVFGGFSFGKSPGASGAGRLATVELALLKGGETVVTLADVQLVALSGEDIPVGEPGWLTLRTVSRVYLPLVMRR